MAKPRKAPDPGAPWPFPVTVFWTARYQYRAKEPNRPHRHDYGQLFLITEGRGHFVTEKGPVSFQPHSLLLVLPGEIHGLTPDPGQRVSTLEAKFNLHPWFHSVLGERPRVQRGDRGTQALLDMLRAEGESGRPYFREGCALIMGQILLGLARERGDDRLLPQSASLADGITDDLCRRALATLEARHTQPFKLKELPGFVGISLRQLERRFRSQAGMTLGHVLRDLRLRTAMNLLRQEGLTAAEVAAKSGFESATHFNRAFKAALGETPVRWRLREREGIRKDIIVAEGFKNRGAPPLKKRPLKTPGISSKPRGPGPRPVSR